MFSASDYLLLLLLPAAGILAVLAMARWLTTGPARQTVGERPWWGNPLVWLLGGAAVSLIGWFVFPQLIGGAFLFLPFIWTGRRRRPPETPQCASCGQELQAWFEHCPRCGAATRG